MCAPATVVLPLVGLGITGATTAYEYSQRKKEAASTAADQKRYEDANQLSAAESTRLMLQDLDERQLEEMFASAQEQQQLNRDTNEAVSTATTAAAEAGVAGHSVDAVMADIGIQGSRNLQTARANASITQSQLEREKQAAVARGISQANGVQPVQVRQPSLLAPILNIAGQTLGTIDDLNERKSATKQPVLRGT